MKKNSRKHLQEVLRQNASCYVLITCGKASKDGKMQVEMTYEGDVALASYLLEGAQLILEGKEDNHSGCDTLRLIKS